ncbi:DNA methyltransferase, partial [Enterococcus hirae]
ANKLHNNIKPSNYKHITLKLIFLKYISNAFKTKHQKLLNKNIQTTKNKNKYLTNNIF